MSVNLESTERSVASTARIRICAHVLDGVPKRKGRTVPLLTLLLLTLPLPVSAFIDANCDQWDLQIGTCTHWTEEQTDALIIQ